MASPVPFLAVGLLGSLVMFAGDMLLYYTPAPMTWTAPCAPTPRSCETFQRGA